MRNRIALIRTGGVQKSSLLEMCHENYIGSYEFVARIVPGAKVERTGGLTAVRTGMPGPSFNVVLGLTRPKSITQVRDGIKRLFLRTHTDFKIITLPETLDELGPVIQELNLTEREVIPGMLLDPIPGFTPYPVKDIQIRQARTSKEITDLLRTGAVGFGDSPDSYDIWKPGFLAGAARPRRGANYVGYVDGKPVATSIRFTTGQMAGIYLVSVLPEFRRRGYGEAMARRAIADGRKVGCTLAYLQASKMGRQIYERIGFRDIEEYSEWKAEVPTGDKGGR